MEGKTIDEVCKTFIETVRLQNKAIMYLCLVIIVMIITLGIVIVAV